MSDNPPPNKNNSFGKSVTFEGGELLEKSIQHGTKGRAVQPSQEEKGGGVSTTPAKKNAKPSASTKKSPPATKQNQLKSKPKAKPSSPTKKRSLPGSKAAPKTKKPKARKRVVPPKIGARKGYRPSLALRLRLFVFIVACMLSASALFLTFYREVGPLGRFVAQRVAPSPIEVTIEPGMSAKEVSLLLEQRGVVDDNLALLAYFIDTDLASFLRSGTFMMDRGMAYSAIGRQLSAKVGEVRIEIPPSFTIAAIDRYLESRGYASKGEFLQATEKLKDEYALSFVEGWLLSGEYAVSEHDPATALAQAMFASMLEAVQPHLPSAQVATWGLEQTLIVASMIQAETQNREEMPLIASVIYNRLEAGQPLGIDATTRYELDDWKNPIPKKALETKTPYNTRRKVGLPPSGICSPSKEAVEAALFPLKSEYFYYLHGLDKRLYPALTYEEHKQNIKAYR